MNEGLDYTRLVDPLLPLSLFDDEATRYLCGVQKTRSIQANALISHTIRGKHLYNLLYASIVCLDSVTILLPQNMAGSKMDGNSDIYIYIYICIDVRFHDVVH
jgi:hypothetical protein